MYLLPQEIEVWYVIPAIRKELAKLLVKKHEMSYEKAGELIGVTKAAVSQYISNKRANKLKLTEGIKKEVEKSADIIVKDNKKSVLEIQRLLRIIREKCSCEICRKFNPSIISSCDCNCKE